MKKDDKIKDQNILGRVEKREVVEEMKEAYLSYAMSVIVARALPDVRDGMKPVHRRILFAMHEIGLNASAKFRKSAAIVGECFVKDTQILTNKGLFPIQEIKIGDLVYTQCGLQKVKRIFCMPEKPLLKVVLKNGLEVTVTSSQKLKIFNGFEYKWKEAKDIKEGDNIVIKADYPFIQNYAELNFFQSKKFLNENIAYALGFFMSEGWISSYGNSKGKRMGFYSNDQEIIERLVGIFEKEFDYKPNIEVKNYILKKKNGEVARNTGYQIRINRKIINDFFIQNFNLNNIYAITKNIPKQIFISPQSVIFAFISGLIDGDGSIRDEESRIHYGSISEKLIIQLLILLQHFDIFSTKHKQKKHAESIVNGRKIKNKHPFYYLEICGIEAKKLSSLLNLASRKKSERVKKIISYSENRLWSHYNIIPDASRVIFKELSDTHLGGGWYKDGEGEKFRMGITYQGGSKLRYSSDLYDKNLSVNQVIDFGILAKLRKINSPLEAELNKIIDNKIRFIPVEKIISANSEETYDLEVENDHEFIANGIVSHNCLAKYHPHGDVAVYDSMARMAQDFSLRYPLVHGQGNWGCFTKDTKIKLADGRDLNFEELIKEADSGKINYTYTINSSGLISIARIKNPRLTKRNAELIKITLDNGEEIKCTFSHLFMLKDGLYKEALTLNSNDSLMPFYQKFSEKTDRLNREGYILIYQPKKNEWIPAHHLADNFNLTVKKYWKNSGRVRHHIDFNKLNNSPENIIRMRWGEHWKIHQQHASEQHKNPDYRIKIAAGRKKYLLDPNTKKKYAKLLSERNIKNWQNPEYRSKMRSEENYSKLRNEIYPYGAATSWSTGFNKYFQGNFELIRQEINKNHKIVKIEKLTEKENVFDLTIENTHNFALSAGIFVHNSIDGDSPAAMRYTEAKMSRIAEETLRDIEKETVDFTPNYDSTVKEPKVLPSAIPQLLLNGTFGIAVGMASNIPPHNLNEVVDATIFLIDKPNAGMEELLKIIKGPDFPTGGLIYNTKDIHEAYATGRGGIVCRGEVEITEDDRGKGQIVISSIPYGVNKSDLILKIAELITEKKIEGVRDVRDESSKEGLRVAIDLKQDSQPQKILNSLYKHTDLEKMFHFNMVALVDGIQPQTLSLKSILEYFIKHREIVVEKRVRFDLRKAEERAHILLGLKKALDHIDAIIKTIKSSLDKEAAHRNLMSKFDLSDRQSAAILEMKLQTLAGLERQKIEDELTEKQKLIRDLKALLQDPKKISGVVKDELFKIKEKYGDERRTKIMARAATSISYEDTIPEVPTILALTQGGYVKRLDPQVYRTQKRGGKGIIGLTTKEEDTVDVFLTAGTHDNVLFFSNKGKVYKIKMFEIPEGNRISKGKSILNFLSLSSDEKITSVLAVPKKAEHQYIMMVTKLGVVKKIGAANFEDVRKSGILAIKLQKDDFLGWANLVSQGDHLIFTTMLGQALRFKESDAREMGRQAGGVTGMRFKKGDELIDVNAINSKEKEADLFVISEKGFGKRTNVRSYRLQRRGGKGTKTAKVTAKTGKLVAAKIIYPEYEGAAAMSKKGQVIKIALAQVPQLGRQTQGVRIMRMDEGDTIASITCF